MLRSLRTATILAVGLAQGQSFEAVSVRQHVPSFHISGDQFTEDAASLKDLIMDAYNVRPFQISGLPGWGNDVYDISAKGKGDRTQVRRMLQTLLADRFQLRLHHETKEIAVYALVVAKNGTKLTRSCGAGGGGKGGRRADDQVVFPPSWDRVVTLLSEVADRPVIDKTGFEGRYCASYGQDPLTALDLADVRSGVVSIFTQVQEKWGLILEPQKGPVDVLVLDHVEKPLEN